MKKGIKEFTDKSVGVLQMDVASIHKELAIMILNAKVNPTKDSNALVKKKKRLAVLLTVITKKKMKEKLDKKLVK